MAPVELKPSICRICGVCCPVVVEIMDGRPVRMTGDRTNHITGGYTCVKGRAHTDLYDHPARLMRSMKRRPDGLFEPISAEQAMDEIALRLRSILDRHGPRALAVYFGTMVQGSVPTGAFMTAFADAVETPMSFNPNTIDKPGKRIARAMLGSWGAPTTGYDEPNVGLLVGLNPFVSYQGLPKTNPGKWLAEAQARGFKLLVIDPRKNDAARRAFVHLQPRPGQDAPILAAMLRVIIEEGRYDAEFVRDHVRGFDDLRRAVAPFTPAVAAERADVDADDVVRAARTFADAGRGYAFAGTGPNFTTWGVLAEYLTLCLITVCGYYLRAGDRVLNPRIFTKSLDPKAQAYAPKQAYGFGEHLRVRGLRNTVAGMPTAALADEILLPGEGQVRALISDAGNPVAAYPDQIKTVEAMQRLDLLVQMDPWMSATAKLAHYVIATKFGFEIPGANVMHDFDAAWGTGGYGRVEAYGHYTAALVEAPAESDLVEDWEFFFGLAQRLELQLVLKAGLVEALGTPIVLDMAMKPTTDDLIEMLTAGSRIPLGEVKRHPRGAEFPDPPVFVAPAEPGHADRLDVGNADMTRDLATTAADRPTPEDGFDLRLIPRRVTHMFNSSDNFASANHGRFYNPAFMHPDDLAHRELVSGDLVRITSSRASIVAEVRSDPSLRTGLVSMTHCYGDYDEVDEQRYREVGSSTARLLTVDGQFDRYSGQPLMTNVPVRVEHLAASGAGP